MKNYYEILECENFISLEEIKKKFKELLLKYHPDKNKNNNNNYSNHKYDEIKEAYDCLKENKNEYDNKLMYYLEELDHSETINISKSNKHFKCFQCGGINDINNIISNIDNNKINIIKCDYCSLSYKLNII